MHIIVFFPFNLAVDNYDIIIYMLYCQHNGNFYFIEFHYFDLSPLKAINLFLLDFCSHFSKYNMFECCRTFCSPSVLSYHVAFNFSEVEY